MSSVLKVPWFIKATSDQFWEGEVGEERDKPGKTKKQKIAKINNT